MIVFLLFIINHLNLISVFSIGASISVLDEKMTCLSTQFNW